jgi:signal transduction histidine kinase
VAKGTLKFKPSARLQFILAEELVSDPNVAVLEFVKNAYDADATDVLIDFELTRDRASSRILIADDGTGMNREEFERNWMHPGYSAKVNAGTTPRSRVPVGEKGLGRMAAGRLGETLDVYTRDGPNEPWLHTHFRWSDFDDMTRDIGQVLIRWDDETDPPAENLGRGTIIEIKGLKMKWDARVPGRRVKGRSTTRLGRLRQDLELLLLPLTVGGQEFEVRLEHDSELPEDVAGKVEPPTMQLLDYLYEFEVKRGRQGWKLRRAVHRSAEIARITGEKVKTVETVLQDELADEVDLDASGPFTGSFYYAPHSGKQLKSLGAPTGVRIYRDDARIDPYGDFEDDWLGASTRKAVRQGHAPIQPNSLYGVVKISKEHNPSLNPLANREGLIENDALAAFLTVCRGEFGAFSKRIQREYLDPQWRDNQEREKRQDALDKTQWATAITRAAAHAVRQPIATADNELSRMQSTIHRSDGISTEVKQRLQKLHDNTRDQLSRIDEAVTKMLGWLEVDPEIRSVDVAVLVAEVIEQLEADAASAEVEIYDEAKGPLVRNIPSGLVEHALEELLENAIRASRPDGRDGEVTVNAIEEEGRLRIAVIDNAAGVKPEIAAKLFEQTVSERGHIGVGLMWNRHLLRIAGGDLEMVSTGPDGSRFDMILP